MSGLVHIIRDWKDYYVICGSDKVDVLESIYNYLRADDKRGYCSDCLELLTSLDVLANVDL